MNHCNQMEKILMVNNASFYCWHKNLSSKSNLRGTASGFLWKEIKPNDQCGDRSATQTQNQAGILVSLFLWPACRKMLKLNGVRSEDVTEDFWLGVLPLQEMMQPLKDVWFTIWLYIQNASLNCKDLVNLCNGLKHSLRYSVNCRRAKLSMARSLITVFWHYLYNWFQIIPKYLNSSLLLNVNTLTFLLGRFIYSFNKSVLNAHLQGDWNLLLLISTRLVYPRCSKKWEIFITYLLLNSIFSLKAFPNHFD